MNKIHRTAAAIAATILTVAALAACGTDDEEARGGAAGNASKALPLTAHVLGPDALDGFASEEGAKSLSVADFAEEHEKKVADLEKSGMAAAAAIEFARDGGEEGDGGGMSIAQQFDTEAQAEAEATRLFQSNSEAEDGTTVTPLTVAGIPGARAIEMSATQEGQELAAVEIVFVDGAVVHEVFLFGSAEDIDTDAVVKAARALYAQVHDHPVSS